MQVRRVYEEWHAGVNGHDIPRVIALYAEHATLESPAILAICPNLKDGILRGRSEIEKFFIKTLSTLSKEFRELYRSDLFFSTGKLLTWEYPRKTPTGEQVDLVLPTESRWARARRFAILGACQTRRAKSQVRSTR